MLTSPIEENLQQANIDSAGERRLASSPPSCSSQRYHSIKNLPIKASLQKASLQFTSTLFDGNSSINSSFDDAEDSFLRIPESDGIQTECSTKEQQQQQNGSSLTGHENSDKISMKTEDETSSRIGTSQNTPKQRHNRKQQQSNNVIITAHPPEEKKSLDGISSMTEILFAKKPSWFSPGHSAVVLDHWQHGQLVWWNRFLANRKKSRGYSTGYHVGRVVDLNSEWFPSVDLSETKRRLRLQASQLGRRSVFLQSMDDLRYMAIPPRAVAVFPDPDPARNLIIWEGCRFNSSVSYRGLLRAEMIQILRNLAGEPNTLLEVELLNLFFHSQGEDPTCTEADIQYLENTNLWEVLRTRQVKPNETPPDELKLIFPPVFSAMPSERKMSGSSNGNNTQTKQQQQRDDNGETTDRQIINTAPPTTTRPATGRQRIGGSAAAGRGRFARKIKQQEDIGEEISCYTGIENNNDQQADEYVGLEQQTVSPAISSPKRAKRRRKPSVDVNETIEAEVGTTRKKSRTEDVTEIEKWVEICKELCLTRKQVEHLLRGIPSILLTSSTGIPWPEDVEKNSMAILKTYLGSIKTPSYDTCHEGIASLVAQHICAANLFLHRLTKTLVVRIPIKCQPATSTTAEVAVSSSASPEDNEAPILQLPTAQPSSSSSSSSSATSRASQLDSSMPNLFVDQPTSEYVPTSGLEKQEEEQDQQLLLPTVDKPATLNIGPTGQDEEELGDAQPEQAKHFYDLAFCTDYGHVNMPKNPPRSSELIYEPIVPPYNCHEPFPCVSYHLGFWACLFRLESFLNQSEGGSSAGPATSKTEAQESAQPNTIQRGLEDNDTTAYPNEYQSTEHDEQVRRRLLENHAIWKTPYPKVKCVKSTLLLIGCGTDSTSPYYRIKLNQISSRKPTHDELTAAARKLMGYKGDRFSVVEIERRLQRLYDLKDVASQLRSIFEDETAFLYQTKGKMTPRDIRYFESLWKELLKKLK